MKKASISVLMMFLMLFFYVFVVAMPVAFASPKSLYICAEHHANQFQAWNINPDGTAVYQATYSLAYTSDPAGISMDESSATLFTTSEFSYGIEMFDAVGLTTIGYAGSAAGLPTNLAGIDVDDANDVVYTVGRWSNLLYVLDWSPATSTLTLRAGFPIALPGLSGAFGASLDESTGLLWVADTVAGVARAYSTSTWTEDTTQSFTPSHKPVDIVVDRVRGFVYTVSMSAGASVPGGSGSYLISKFDLATRTEATYNIGHQGVGIAVDEITGYVYVTGSPTGTPPYDNLEVWNPATWTQIQQTSDIGNPAGIYVPQEEVAYNPLGLSKSDNPDPVLPGNTITYTITYDNTQNQFDVHNVVLVDNLPPEVTFVSATGGGVYDSVTHTVTWNLGTLTAGSGPFSVTLVVTVIPGTPLGTTITNYATIDCDETPPTTVTEDTTVGGAPGVPEFGFSMVMITSLISALYFALRKRYTE